MHLCLKRRDAADCPYESYFGILARDGLAMAAAAATDRILHDRWRSVAVTSDPVKSIVPS